MGWSCFVNANQLGSHTEWNFLTLQLVGLLLKYSSHFARKAKRFHFLFLEKTALANCFLLIRRTTQKHVTMVNHLQEQEVTGTWLQGASQRTMVTNGGRHDLQTGSKHQSHSILPSKEIVSPWHTPSTESNNKKRWCKVVPMLCPGTRAEALTSLMAN